jgi:hypothetical protein
VADLPVEIVGPALIGLAVALARSATQWWLCRTPLGRVNFELARQRARRRR